MTILQIENRPDLVKHTESAAILAADVSAYQAYLNTKKAKQSLENRVCKLESQVRHLEELINRLTKP